MIIKRRRKRLITKFNVIITIMAIFIGLCVASIGNTMTEVAAQQDQNQFDTLIYSVTRVADAFEIYNEKRF